MALCCLLCKATLEKLLHVKHCQHCGIITCDKPTCGKMAHGGPQEVWICDNCITVELEPSVKST